MKQLNLAILLSLLCIVSCKTQKESLETYEGMILEFGNSGGFTGTIDCYKLMENGQLFKSTDGSNFMEIQALKKDLAKQMFQNFETLGFNEMRINDPGNMTFYVSMGQGKRMQTLKWGGTSQVPDPNLKRFYTNLFKLAKQSSNPVK